jgi:hypothetical protein
MGDHRRLPHRGKPALTGKHGTACSDQKKVTWFREGLQCRQHAVAERTGKTLLATEQNHGISSRFMRHGCSPVRHQCQCLADCAGNQRGMGP